jgi:hypothetical protein
VPKKISKSARPSQKPKLSRPKTGTVATEKAVTPLILEQTAELPSARREVPAPTPRTKPSGVRPSRASQAGRLGDTTTEYAYVRKDVARIAVVAASLFIVLIVLSVFMR